MRHSLLSAVAVAALIGTQVLTPEPAPTVVEEFHETTDHIVARIPSDLGDADADVFEAPGDDLFEAPEDDVFEAPTFEDDIFEAPTFEDDSETDTNDASVETES